jgi:hypothetical protein
MKRDKIWEEGRVVGIEREKSYSGTCMHSLLPHDHSEDLVVGGRIILNWILKEYDWMCGLT